MVPVRLGLEGYCPRVTIWVQDGGFAQQMAFVLNQQRGPKLPRGRANASMKPALSVAFALQPLAH